MHGAAFCGAFPDLIYVLLKYGANPSMKGYDGKRPVDIARVKVAIGHGPRHNGVVQVLSNFQILCVLASARSIPRISKRSFLKVMPVEIIRRLRAMMI